MIAVITILLAVPLGFFLRSHLAANVAYAIAYLWAFTYQTLYLLTDSIANPDSSTAAFSVEGSEVFPWSYGLVASTIFGVGFGLVWLGHRLGSRRRAKIHAR